MKKSYKKNIALYLSFAIVIAVMAYFYISMNIESNKLSKQIDDLKSEIKVELSGINSNKAILDKLVSKEFLVPLAESKLNLTVANDTTAPITISREQVEDLEERINLLNEH
ncbi:MAG: hypothetical protein J0L60_16005 [Ignavibacteria bacterium]|nr:hypothetical protein [Ignavibacteria bacterium]